MAKRQWQPEPTPILVILDMNGVLLVRSGSGRKYAALRPHLEEFLSTLFEELAGRVQVAVWSSMMQHNLHPLVYEAFGPWSDSLAFVWDQQWCTQRWVPNMAKPLLRKDLKYLKDTVWRGNVPDRVLLIDDDPIKCTANPQGTAVHPATWEGPEQADCTELRRLAGYIRELASYDCNSVREFVLARPFEDFRPGATGGNNSDNAGQNPAKRRRVGGEEQQSADSVKIGDEVEAYWPDEAAWLPAKVKKVLGDGSVQVTWQEDGSESDVPADYVRRLKRKSAWQRMSSRRTTGVYYYYNTETGVSQPEPPEPWTICEARGRPGQHYYWNPVSGRESWEKPELSDEEH